MEVLGAQVWSPSASLVKTSSSMAPSQRLNNNKVRLTKVNIQSLKLGLGYERFERRKTTFVVRASAVAEKVNEITLDPIKTISGKIKLPGSKSLSNRTLLLAALSEVPN